jgi:hypothetical protein
VDGEPVPDFSPIRSEYVITRSPGTPSVRVTAAKSDPAQTVSINGETGVESIVQITDGNNDPIVVRVTSSGGYTHNYYINITITAPPDGSADSQSPE